MMFESQTRKLGSIHKINTRLSTTKGYVETVVHPFLSGKEIMSTAVNEAFHLLDLAPFCGLRSLISKLQSSAYRTYRHRSAAQ